MIKKWDLIAGYLLAVDGSKFRAVNSKKNNYNQQKIQRHLNYIDQKIDACDSEITKFLKTQINTNPEKKAQIRE